MDAKKRVILDINGVRYLRRIAKDKRPCMHCDVADICIEEEDRLCFSGNDYFEML